MTKRYKITVMATGFRSEEEVLASSPRQACKKVLSNISSYEDLTKRGDVNCAVKILR